MSRNITITFSDGSSHRYENIPSTVTPDQIEARVKKDFPNRKIKNIDGGRKSSSAELDQVKKNAGLQQSSNLSQFSIKGLRFGMTLEQVLNITGAQVDDYSQRMDQKTYAYPKKAATSWSQALTGFTIAGIPGGAYGWTAKSENNKLVQLSMFPKSENVDSLLSTFSSQYGKPKLRQYKSRTKGGLELNDYTASWNIQDAVIEMNRHIDRDTGYISIASKSHRDQEAEKYKSQDEKARKDFE